MVVYSMLLYHGTLAIYVDSIRREGLLPPKAESWQNSFWCYEIGLPPSTFMATQPRASQDSDPLYFARLGNAWFSDARPGTAEGDGYIVIIKCSWQDLVDRLEGSGRLGM